MFVDDMVLNWCNARVGLRVVRITKGVLGVHSIAAWR